MPAGSAKRPNDSRGESTRFRGLEADVQLAVEPQQVVPVEAETADWWFGFQAAVRAMPIVSVKPDGQLGGSVIGGGIGLGVGPFPERRLDEAFRLAVGLGRIGPCPDVLEAEIAADDF